MHSDIEDYAILLFIKRNGEENKCDYCEKHKNVIGLDPLMIFLTDTLTHFFTDQQILCNMFNLRRLFGWV